MNGFVARNRLILLAWAAVAVLLLVTALFSPGFLAPANLSSTLVLAAFIGIVAFGQTFVIIGGGIDLSIPWVLNSAAIALTLMADGQDAALVWAFPLILAAGAVIGWVNGIGVAWFGVPPIIMTLAVNGILQGLLLVYTGGSPAPAAPEFVKFLVLGQLGGVPVVAWIWLALALVATVLLSKSTFGRHLYALGSSATVARFSGVPTARTSIVTYMISGTTAALAGIVLTGYSGVAYLGMGNAYLFTSVAAVAIGGASILGGNGHYLGTVAGALVLTVLAGLLPALNLSSGALQVVYGGVILLTVSLSSQIWTPLFRRAARQFKQENRHG